MIIPDTLRGFFNAFDEYQQRAALLLVIANAAASPAFKSRYRKRWWQMVEERARLASLTESNLVGWSSQVSSRLDGQVARNAEHRAAWEAVIRAGDDRRVLAAIDRDAPALITFVRAWSDAKRAEYQEENE